MGGVLSSMMTSPPPLDPRSASAVYQRVRPRRWWAPGVAAHRRQQDPAAVGTAAGFDGVLIPASATVLAWSQRYRRGSGQPMQIQAKMDDAHQGSLCSEWVSFALASSARAFSAMLGIVTERLSGFDDVLANDFDLDCALVFVMGSALLILLPSLAMSLALLRAFLVAVSTWLLFSTSACSTLSAVIRQNFLMELLPICPNLEAVCTFPD